MGKLPFSFLNSSLAISITNLRLYFGSRRKQTKIIYSRGTQDPTKQIDTPEKDQKLRCFTDEDAVILGQWCAEIEKHYSNLHGHATPMDIEWAKDGETGELFIVQARPETVRSRQASGCLRQTHVLEHGETVIRGTAIGSDAAAGHVHVIKDLMEISSFKPGEILVADMTDPDWVSLILTCMTKVIIFFPYHFL